MSLAGDFFNLFYPKVCASCSDNLLANENVICTKCRYEMPKTNFLKEKNNPVSQIFWGRVPIENACSYYFFYKGSVFQKLIHKLKYNGLKEIGYELGLMFGHELKDSPHYKDVDLLIPVPLHPKKLKKRGYNQSEWIIKGLADGMNLPYDKDNLFRNMATETQTRKSRFDRWKNVENIFQVRNPELFAGKHILIADDVITTGATFEACAQAIVSIPNTKISVVALASASNS